MARLKNQGIRRAISDLARRGLAPEASPVVELQDGIPVWKRLTPALAAASLARFKAGFSGVHHFWMDEISLTDTAQFDLPLLTGSRQTTDAYLAGLAFRRDGRLATLEGSIPWHAVRGAEAGLVERIVT